MKHLLPLTLITACAGADAFTIDTPPPVELTSAHADPLERAPVPSDEPEADAPEDAPILFRVVDQPTRCADASLDYVLDVAIARWRSATCLPIERSDSAPHRWSWAFVEHMAEPSRIAQSTGPWSGVKTLLRADIMCPAVTGSFDQAIRTGTHEMWHVLARYNGHIENDGVADSGGGGDWNRFDAPIDEAALTRVCNARDCGCFMPED